MHQIMEFILPVLSASGEAVIMVLILVVLFIVGRGRMQPLPKTLRIERPGAYRMVLAPGLNLAQPFIEAVAGRLAADAAVPGADLPLCFAVADKEVATSVRPVYFLTISLQDGMLHFAAQDAVLPVIGIVPAEHAGAAVEDRVRAVAETWGIKLRRAGQAEPQSAAGPV